MPFSLVEENVLRDGIITSEEINKDIDKILARSK